MPRRRTGRLEAHDADDLLVGRGSYGRRSESGRVDGADIDLAAGGIVAAKERVRQRRAVRGIGRGQAAERAQPGLAAFGGIGRPGHCVGGFMRAPVRRTNEQRIVRIRGVKGSMLHDMIGVADVRAHFPVEDGGIFVGRCPEFALVGVQIIRPALGHDHFLGQAVIGAPVVAEQILIQRAAPGLRQAGQRITVSIRQIGQRLDRLPLRGIAFPSVGRAFGRPVGPARGDDLQPGRARLLGLQELGQLHNRSLIVAEYTRFVVHFEIGEV
ncbi:hypothetical protein D3C73_1052390 [compost metagenome]